MNHGNSSQANDQSQHKHGTQNKKKQTYSCNKVSIKDISRKEFNFRYSWWVEILRNSSGINDFASNLFMYCREDVGSALGRGMTLPERMSGNVSGKTKITFPDGVRKLSNAVKLQSSNAFPSLEEVEALDGKTTRSSNLAIFGRFNCCLANKNGALESIRDEIINGDGKPIANLSNLLSDIFPIKNGAIGLSFPQRTISTSAGSTKIIPAVEYKVESFMTLPDPNAHRRSPSGFILHQEGQEIPKNKTDLWYEEWQLVLPPKYNCDQSHGQTIDLFFTCFWPKQTQRSPGSPIEDVTDDIGSIEINIPKNWCGGDGRFGPYQLVELIVDPNCTDNC